MTNNLDVSVIVTVSDRFDDIEPLHARYAGALQKTSLSYEFIYVLDGPYPTLRSSLESIPVNDDSLRIVQLSRQFGESTALSVGFDNARAPLILTLPPYEQIEPDEIPRILEAAASADMVLANRSPREDPLVNRLQSRVFRYLLDRVSDLHIQDPGCGVRAFARKVVDEVSIYGDLHRFLPLLAHKRGFRIEQVDLRQSAKDKYQRLHRPGVYTRRLLDLLTIFFLVKFTKKPLRFFGLIGGAAIAAGGTWTLYLIIDRLVFDVALADRPALLLSTLLLVLGVQALAIGLIGELIIFSHARDQKEYVIAEIVPENSS